MNPRLIHLTINQQFNRLLQLFIMSNTSSFTHFQSENQKYSKQGFIFHCQLKSKSLDLKLLTFSEKKSQTRFFTKSYQNMDVIPEFVSLLCTPRELFNFLQVGEYKLYSSSGQIYFYPKKDEKQFTIHLDEKKFSEVNPSIDYQRQFLSMKTLDLTRQMKQKERPLLFRGNYQDEMVHDALDNWQNTKVLHNWTDICLLVASILMLLCIFGIYSLIVSLPSTLFFIIKRPLTWTLFNFKTKMKSNYKYCGEKSKNDNEVRGAVYSNDQPMYEGTWKRGFLIGKGLKFDNNGRPSIKEFMKDEKVSLESDGSLKVEKL